MIAFFVKEKTTQTLTLVALIKVYSNDSCEVRFVLQNLFWKNYSNFNFSCSDQSLLKR